MCYQSVVFLTTAKVHPAVYDVAQCGDIIISWRDCRLLGENMKYFYFQGRKHIVGLDFWEEGGGWGSRVGWRVRVYYCLLQRGCLVNMSDMLFPSCR